MSDGAFSKAENSVRLYKKLIDNTMSAHEISKSVGICFANSDRFRNRAEVVLRNMRVAACGILQLFAQNFAQRTARACGNFEIF